MVGKWPLMIDINKGITLSSLSFMPYNPWKRCCVILRAHFFSPVSFPLIHIHPKKRMDMALGLLLITRRLKEKRTRAPKMSYFQGNQFLLANEAARKAALLLRAPRDRMLNSNKARKKIRLNILICWNLQDEFFSLFRLERNLLALLIQNRVSEVFAVDIHPGARIGRGILLDHATGVVAGETAVIGNNISILHNVTMGGTGWGCGVVLIEAETCVLGNIRIGEGSKIGAGSVVLMDVPPRMTAVWNPARLVGGRRSCSKF
ncbi:hypothetical protein SAY87_014514 [Trapa incisa]|uniref:Serine O-acetyltransferase n=1 Tax=Trapa incisa TaxID=236973 RepID=A0AAN7GN93_9MYRT|nr:hypothetical protein SAY87_014514 [Trapa incisa]